MSIGIMRNGVPLDVLYGQKGATKAADFGIKQNGVDISNYILALADGQALGFNAGCARNGTDTSAVFGVPNGNTPLPINGQNFSVFSQSGTTTSSCSIAFTATTSGWSISSVSSSGGSQPSASGSIPSGATAVMYSYTESSSGGDVTATNNAPSKTNITSSGPSIGFGARSTPSTGDNHITAAVTINFYNSAGAVISTTNITMRATATGSA